MLKFSNHQALIAFFIILRKKKKEKIEKCKLIYIIYMPSNKLLNQKFY